MYCKQCEKEISQQDKFCMHCGAYLCEPTRTTKVFGLALRIFAFILALVFLYGVRIDAMHGLGIISVTFFYGYGETIFFVLFVFGAILGLWMAFVLILMAFCRTARNIPALTHGVVAGGLTMLILRILLLAFFLEDSSWFQHFKNRQSLTSEQLNSAQLNSIVVVLICIVGVYLLLLLMKQAPSIKTLFRDSSGKLSEIIAIPKVSFLKHFDKRDLIVDAEDSNNSGTTDLKKPIKTNRSILVYIFFTIVTLGIFDWFYTCSLAIDVDIICKDDGEKNANLLSFFLYNLVTYGIYSFYFKHRLNSRLVSYGPHYGKDLKEKVPKIFLLCSVVLTVCGFLAELSSSRFTFLYFSLYLYFIGLIIRYIASFIAMFILINNTNTLAGAYNRSDSD